MPETPELLNQLADAQVVLDYCTQDLGSKCTLCESQHAIYDAQCQAVVAANAALEANVAGQASLQAQIQALTDAKNVLANAENNLRHDAFNAEQAKTNGAQDVWRAELAKYQAEVAKQAAADAVAAIQAQIDAE